MFVSYAVAVAPNAKHEKLDQTGGTDVRKRSRPVSESCLEEKFTAVRPPQVPPLPWRREGGSGHGGQKIRPSLLCAVCCSNGFSRPWPKTPPAAANGPNARLASSQFRTIRYLYFLHGRDDGLQQQQPVLVKPKQRRPKKEERRDKRPQSEIYVFLAAGLNRTFERCCYSAVVV